jgi:rhamnose transport system substrate-binding protein
VKSFVLWDPVNLGYLTVWAGREMVQGRPLKPVNDVSTIGKVKYLADKKMLLLGPPTVFDASNVDKYDF